MTGKNDLILETYAGSNGKSVMNEDVESNPFTSYRTEFNGRSDVAPLYVRPTEVNI